MTGYVSPFQERGHDGPCRDLKWPLPRPEDMTPKPASAQLTKRQSRPSMIHIVPAEGDGTPLATGDIGPLPVQQDENGRVFVRSEDVFRALATLLRDIADDLDRMSDVEALDEQHDRGEEP